MNQRLVIAFILICTVTEMKGQDTYAGSGYALSFDGVDDYINLGNIYDDIQLPLTISCWMFLDPGGLGTIFASQDNSHIYNGFHLFVVHTAIVIEYGDGNGNNSAEFRRGKAAPIADIFGKWVHVTAIMRGRSDMDLYLNGINLGGTYIGNTQEPMNSSFPSEIAKIGYNSKSVVTYHFQGAIDELRIWNRSLSQEEIREQMCRKLRGNEQGLIGYWDFDDTKANILFDKSPNHYDGQLTGGPKRIFSGAPIGDENFLLYTDNLADTPLIVEDSLDRITVKNISGSAEGVHLYKVNTFPDQSKGLNTTTVTDPYYGVFIASVNNDNFFDLDYEHNNAPVCRLYTRTDNSVSEWDKNSALLSLIADRTEFIKELSGTEMNVDLGQDETSCTMQTRLLSPLTDTVSFEFLWQDGSRNSIFFVDDFGTYWVKIDNGCTGDLDSLNIYGVDTDDLEIPNVFTPNDDPLNQCFEIDSRIIGGELLVFDRWGVEVYRSSNYQNNWDGDDLPSGVYFYTLNGGECIEQKKGTLTILR